MQSGGFRGPGADGVDADIVRHQGNRRRPRKRGHPALGSMVGDVSRRSHHREGRADVDDGPARLLGNEHIRRPFREQEHAG